MNKGTLSTSVARTPVGEAVAEQSKTIADLFEAPIDDARRMASILAGLLEDGLGKDMSEYGRPDHYYVTADQMNNIMFSIYKVEDFIGQIHNAFEEALLRKPFEGTRAGGQRR